MRRDVAADLAAAPTAKDQHQALFTAKFIGDGVHETLTGISPVTRIDIDMQGHQTLRAMVATAARPRWYRGATCGADEGLVDMRKA